MSDRILANDRVCLDQTGALHMKNESSEIAIITIGILAATAVFGRLPVSPLYLVSPANIVATLTADSNYTYWTVKFQNGEQRIFSYASGSLTAIIDRNGNTTQLSYDAGNRLVTVTDPGGRHLYFNYPNGSSYLVSSVTSDVGITVTYSYDSQNRLSKVTENDGSFATFTYDANSNITAIKDSLGNLIESHTYDSEHRGLTSSHGSAGAEAVTISYPNP